MKLLDFGQGLPDRTWFQRILEWSRKKISFEDNIDCAFITANVGTGETEVGHPLGRAPKYLIEVAAYPNGTAGISFTKEPDNKRVFIKRGTAGQATFLLL
jgi:hypothetical protein